MQKRRGGCILGCIPPLTPLRSFQLATMSRLLLGVISGIFFGIVVVLTMIPLTFADRRTAFLAAFMSRFTIGVLIGASIGSPQLVALRAPGWILGAAVGLLVSIPDAIVTKAYAPILIMGTLGGAAIGYVVQRFGAVG